MFALVFLRPRCVCAHHVNNVWLTECGMSWSRGADPCVLPLSPSRTDEYYYWLRLLARDLVTWLPGLPRLPPILLSPLESGWPRAGPRLLKHSILIQSANRTNSQWSGQRAESSQPLTQSHGNPATANSGHSPEHGNCPQCSPAKLANQVLKSWAFPFVLAGIKHFKSRG